MSSRSSGAAPDPATLAFIALGSNLPSAHGSPAATVNHAMTLLEALGDGPLLRSSLWSSRPLDCPPGSPDFVNAVVGLLPKAGELPTSLLKKLQALELACGRRRSDTPNAPRTLDLDLIAFAGRREQGDFLTLPHPAAGQRGFVMLPLAEIAPDLVLPGLECTVAQLAGELQQAAPGAVNRVG